MYKIIIIGLIYWENKLNLRKYDDCYEILLKVRIYFYGLVNNIDLLK